MDDYNNPLSETPGGQPERGAATAARMKLSEKAAEVKERVADFGRKTADNIDESRKSTAGALDQTAAKLHSSGDRLSGAAHTAADQISGAAHGTADKLRAAADYIRDQRWPPRLCWASLWRAAFVATNEIRNREGSRL